MTFKNNVYLNLPTPSDEAIAHSNQLIDLIKQIIIKEQGKITFEAFMNLALYAPGLGYYSAGSRKIGPDGDFITAPEISSAFSYCIARQCRQVLSAFDHGNILEFGAGSGRMAIDILSYLNERSALPNHYFILETSAELKDRQQSAFEKQAPELLPQVKWLTALPTNFEGIILANEVLDAMPVRRFLIDDDSTYEYYVTYKDNQLSWIIDKPSDERLTNELLQLKREGLLKTGPFTSEINLRAGAWINSLSQCIKRGAILLIDYGFPREIYYHPERKEGTLMCHYRHHAHPNPLILVGLQDITAHIDFSFIAQTALNAGLTISGYRTQSKFLLNCGLLDFTDSAADLPQRLTNSRQIQTLTMPHEMGELFKVLLLSKNVECELYEKNSSHNRQP